MKNMRIFGFLTLFMLAQWILGHVQTFAVTTFEGQAIISPILRIDTEGDMSQINRIIFSRDGKYLISAGNDKTIRVRDVNAGKVIRTIRGEIADQGWGTIYAADLSPDNRWLAVGGSMPVSGSDQAVEVSTLLEDQGLIRMYDFSSGEQRSTLRGSMGVIKDIKFSPDGRYLASTESYKGTARIWDFINRKLLQKIEDPNDSVPGVPGISWSADGQRFLYYIIKDPQKATVLSLYEMSEIASGRTRKIADLSGSMGIRGSVVFSPDGQYLVASGVDHAIHLWDGKTGRYLRALFRGTQDIRDTAFTPDGKALFATVFPDLKAGAKNDGIHGQVWSFPEGTPLTTLTQNDPQSVVATGAISPSGQMVATADYKGTIYLWQIQDGKVLRVLEGVGQPIYSVGISANGQSIAWGSKPPCPGQLCVNEIGVLEQSFDLNLLKEQDLKDASSFNRTITRLGDMTLVPINSGPFNVPYYLEIRSGGKPLVKTPIRYLHQSFTLIADGKMFLSSGEPAYGLLLYRTHDGQPIARLIGHTAGVMAVAVSSDGKWAVTGSADQTICLWRLEGIDLTPQTPGFDDFSVDAYVREKRKIDPAYVIDRKKILNLLKQTMTKEKWDEQAVVFRFTKLPTVSPTLSIFPGTNGEWVAWTSEGFFTASKSGAKHIGYHLNRGPDRNADFIEIDRLYDLFYRPDLVSKKIQGASLAEEAARLNVEKVLAGGMPPSVAFVSPQAGARLDQREITLEAELTDLGGGVGNVLLQINGITIGKQGGDGRGIALTSAQRKNVLSWKARVSLQPGENVISLTAYNKANTVESTPANLSLFVKDAISEPPSLHLLAIGINKYRDRDLWLKYAVPDAQAFVTLLKGSTGTLFKEVKISTLLDEQGTTSGIDEAFKEISSQVKSNDVFVLYLAGHGLTYDGRFHFIPQEFVYQNEESVPKKAVTQDRIQQWLAAIPALKSMILIDTCNSGSYAEALSRGMAEKTAIDKLTRATGRATIVASSKTQVALEGYEGHGVFTYVLLEGLKGTAIKTGNKDGLITVNDLAQYIGDEVPRITLKQFGYEQFPMQHLHGNNFPISIVK
jgi:WD40 repeat protein